MPQFPFEIGRGALNEGLKEIPGWCMPPVSMPERFEDFVRFPPVGPVIKIDAVQIVFGRFPMFWLERAQKRIGLFE